MSLLPLNQFKGIKIFNREIYYSDIGFFLNTFSIDDLESTFVQDSASFSINKGTVRGMHFQLPPYSQAKIINVLQGEIIDFVIDLRPDSDTFLSYGKIKLNLESPHTIYIPRGFAHGFITMLPNTIVAYKLDNKYSPENERTLLWNDKDINIKWPKMEHYFLSSKDQKGSSLKEIKDYLIQND